MKYRVEFDLETESAEQAADLRDQAIIWLQWQGAIVTNPSYQRITRYFHIWGARKDASDNVVAVDGIFEGDTQADAEAAALAAAGPTAIITHVERI